MDKNERTMETIIIGRKGNQKFPISDITVSRQHCKVTANDDGTYTLENLSSAGTLVDGIPIIRTTVTLDSKISLGKNFTKTLRELIGSNIQEFSKTNKEDSKSEKIPEFSIKHLEKIWEDFNSSNLLMAEKQRKINLTRAGLGVFTMCAMPTIFFLGPVGYILTGIGVIGNTYSFIGMRNSETLAQRQQRQDMFEEAWVCPNPECGRNLPAKNYKTLIRNHSTCPYCKCKYLK